MTAPRMAPPSSAGCTARSAEEEGHAEGDQQDRADQVEHADRDEAEVFGHAE